MRTAAYLAASFALALSAAAQDGKPAAAGLTDAQAGPFGAFVAEKLDAHPGAEDVEKAIREKLEEIRKAPATTTETKKDEAPAKGKRRAKKAGAEGAKKRKNDRSGGAPEIKNGLTESDRIAFGQFALQELSADRHGQALVEALTRELERVRAERVKQSSPATRKNRKRLKKSDR